MFSLTNPGVGNRSSNFRIRRAVYPVSSSNSRCAPVSKLSSGSLLPATSSQRYWRTECRYCRIIRMRPSGNTGRTTTEPGCVTISRVAFTPPGSITTSRRTPNTRPLNNTSLLKILAKALFLAMKSPAVNTPTSHSTGTAFSSLEDSCSLRFLAALLPVAYTGSANPCP